MECSPSLAAHILKHIFFSTDRDVGAKLVTCGVTIAICEEHQTQFLAFVIFWRFHMVNSFPLLQGLEVGKNLPDLDSQVLAT
jgi:hypothetical protein